MDLPKIAEVIVDIPAQEVDRVFDYSIPQNLQGRVTLGSVARVPFGKTVQVGYVVGLKKDTDLPKLAEIFEVLEETILTKEQIDLARWIADYYLSSFSEALRLMLPPGRSRKPGCKVILLIPEKRALTEVAAPKTHQNIIKLLIEAGGSLDLSELKTLVGQVSLSSVLNAMEESGILKRSYAIGKPAVKTKKVQYARLKSDQVKQEEFLRSLKSAPKQRAVMEMLAEKGEMPVLELLAKARADRSSLKSLVQKEQVDLVDKETFREPDTFFPEVTKVGMDLTTAQEKAIEEILKSMAQGRHEIFLLQGVTGSGKTEIYLRTIAEVIKKGKRAIVLVPEISLTPQTVQRFKARFGDGSVAVLHSGLSLGERYDQWMRIARGDYHVVVGARSAVFAPLEDIDLIVIDEEHETTYKQNRNPRYHAKDVAMMRARLNDATVVLGSATPSLESRWLAEKGNYRLLILPERVEGKELPQTKVINMREAFADKSKTYSSRVISPELQDSIMEASEQGWKTILFLNRRGYSGFIQCRDCGGVIKCDHCEVTMTYHLTGMKMKCHHCGSTSKAPQVCPDCQSLRIGYFGAGTQRIETEITELFPKLPLVRMDADSTKRKGTHQRKLAEFLQSEKAILLGTQMIAKGLDFPEVTLVGIINADVALNLPDFRAGERTFQLLMQVSGRAGRGEKSGQVLIQSYQPENYAIRAVLRGDYDDFYSSEIKFRKSLNYPPLSRLINLVFSGMDEKKVENVAENISRILAESNVFETAEVLGPVPAPLSKIKNHYRWHLVIKSARVDEIKDFLRQNYRGFLDRAVKEKVTLIIDVDPVTML